MILRNPAAMRDSFFGFILSAVLLCLSNLTLYAQGISGTIRDAISQQSIRGARVELFVHDSLIAEGQTTETGTFELITTATARVRLKITAAGYIPDLIDNLPLDGYNTLRIEHMLEKSPIDLEGVQVVASAFPKVLSVETITRDDLSIVPGNFDDPVRITHSAPGVVLLNDQANHISVRGQSPVFNSWYLEGLQILNPSHTNNAGTLSDLPTSYGGGINLFSAQILGQTDFYTGIRPMGIGHNAGATINMHLHETAKPEWRAKAGLLGFEIGGGLDLQAQRRFDFNVRYSFTGLLANLGVDFGGEKIGFYDGVLSYHQQGQRHKLKWFAWAGRSTNDFDRVAEDEEREEFKDFFNIEYKNSIWGTGLKYQYSLNDNAVIKTGIAYSSVSSSHRRNGVFNATSIFSFFDQETALISSFGEMSLRHSRKVNTTLGVYYQKRTYPNPGIFSIFMEEESLRPALQTSVYLGSAIQLELGAELYRSFLFDKSIPGYTANVRWNLSPRQRLTAGLRHQAGDPVPGSFASQNTFHFQTSVFEIGYQYGGVQHKWQLNAFVERMTDLQVNILTQSVVHFPDYPFERVNEFVVESLPDGFARYMGLEGKWEYQNPKGWRIAFNQSLYESVRGIEDQEAESSRYDGRYATHVVIAKEITSARKGKNRLWNFALRGIWNGGLLEAKIDTAFSQEDFITVVQSPKTFDQRLPDFKRVDISLSRTISTTHFRWRYALDIQNLLGLTNVSYHYYDPFLEEVKAQEHLGIIPVLSVQVSW